MSRPLLVVDGDNFAHRSYHALPKSIRRRGIRAVAGGDDPAGLCRVEGGVIPTYCNDTIVRLPSAETPESDKQLMRETGRRLAQGYLKEPPLTMGL